MTALVWIGALLTFAGLGLLGYCIAVAVRARKAGATGAAMQERLQRLVAINLGALALSAFGLMVVIVGVMIR